MEHDAITPYEEAHELKKERDAWIKEYRAARAEVERLKAERDELKKDLELMAAITGNKVHLYASTIGPDFGDCAANYFQDEASVKAGIQLQKDAWNAAVDTIVAYINQKNLVQVDVIDRFRI